MAVKRTPGFLIFMRRVALWSMALRYGFTLVRFGIKNMVVLQDYKRNLMPPTQHSILKGVWLAGGRYARLFRMIPSLEKSLDTRERRRLTNIFQQVDAVCRNHRPGYDPLTAPSAIKVQTAAVRFTFQRLFGLKLTNAEAEALGRYGSASLVIKDFLQYCGYQQNSSVHLTLSLQLPLFVAKAEERHDKLISRQKILLNLDKKSDLISESGFRSKMFSSWFKLQQIVCRMYWSRSDMRERMNRLASHSRVHEEVYREAALPMIRLAAASQERVRTMLAYEMFFQAIEVLADLHQANPPGIDDPAPEDDKSPGQSFYNAISRLECNLSITLPDCF